MGIDAFIETNTGKSYSVKNRLLIPLYDSLNSYCQGYEGHERLQSIEDFFDNEACAILGPIVGGYYYAPLANYTENDFDAYYRDFSPRADGVPVTKEDFLKEIHHVNQIWQDINHYIDVIKRLRPAIDYLHKHKQDPVHGYGPKVVNELLTTLEVALQEGAKTIRLAVI